MTAQKELAHLLGNDTEHDKSSARRFIRDHGPAIAELIEAASDIAEQGGIWTAGSQRLRYAIRKLTEPK